MKRLIKSRKNAAAMPTTETLKRRSKNASRAWLSACVLVGLLTGQAMAVNIEMVTVGNAGNAPDMRYAEDVGSVSYIYQIGKYEVTAGQYTEFLNAVAKADPNGLYSAAMGDPSDFGWRGANIQRTGSSPHYSYSVATDWANRPVNYVSFWNAARFANWLHNGQPTGAQGPATTEGGAYHNVGDQLLFGRNTGAKFFVPTEDEWYKAAYHDRTAGLAASYFDFPTGTNAVPGRNINESTNAGNNANHGYAIGSPYYRTVGGEFELSHSPYGTFDQGGNVAEWNETPLLTNFRGLRGGEFDTPSDVMRANFRNGYDPTQLDQWGFRVASNIPEPASWILALLGAVGLAVGAMRRRSSGRNFIRASGKKHPPVILFPRVAALFSAIGLLAAAPSSLIAGAPFTPFPISTLPDHGEVASRIDGRYVVWTELEYRGGPTATDSNDVLGYDLQTHQAFPIATGSAEQDSPVISGDLAAWYDGGHIFAKHLSPGGGAAFNVTPFFGSEQYGPAVSGNLIVWTDSRFAHQTIWGRYVDQPASSAFQISSTAAYEQFTPDVAGKIVVWATFGETGDGRNIYGRDLSGAINGGAIFPICSDPGVQDNPHVSGNIAIWEDSRSGTPQIYGKNLITGVEFLVSEGGTTDQFEPQIDGNMVVWQDAHTGPGFWDVWARDLSSGGPAFPVTATTDYYEQYVDVSGKTVVWSQTGGDIFGGDIYGAVIPEPSTAGMSVIAAACLAAYVASLRNRLPHR